MTDIFRQFFIVSSNIFPKVLIKGQSGIALCLCLEHFGLLLFSCIVVKPDFLMDFVGMILAICFDGGMVMGFDPFIFFLESFDLFWVVFEDCDVEVF